MKTLNLIVKQAVDIAEILQKILQFWEKVSPQLSLCC